MSLLTIIGRTDPLCGCCQPDCIVGFFSCETEGGQAELCGNSEYVGFESTPPKKYRKQTLTGFSQVCNLSGPPQIVKRTYSGTYEYDRDTCSVTNTSIYHEETNHFATTCGDGTPEDNGNVTRPSVNWFDAFGVPTAWTNMRSATSDEYTGVGPPPIPFFGIATGTATGSLSVEDTETDAVTRVIAANPWGPCAGSPCCRAAWEQRTTGFLFEYTDARWTVTATGLVPGKAYRVIINYFRRTYGVGSYVPFMTVPYSNTADGSGNLTVQGLTPNEIGFETYAEQGTCP